MRVRAAEKSSRANLSRSSKAIMGWTRGPSIGTTAKQQFTVRQCARPSFNGFGPKRVVSCRRKQQDSLGMSIKYYTHFRLKESEPGALAEYRGVVELTQALSRSDKKAAAAVLARSLECHSGDVSVLQWSRLQ
jgi:hypothetical protein